MSAEVEEIVSKVEAFSRKHRTRPNLLIIGGYKLDHLIYSLGYTNRHYYTYADTGRSEFLGMEIVRSTDPEMLLVAIGE